MIRWTLGATLVLMALGAVGCRSRCGCPPCGARTPLEPPAPRVATTQTEVFLDASIMSVTPTELAGIGGYSPAGGSAQSVSESDAASIASRFASKLVAAPKILVLAGQQATVSVGEFPNDDPAAWTGFIAELQLRETDTPTVDFEWIRVRKRDTASTAEQTIRADAVRVEDGGTLLLVGPEVAGQHLIGVLKVRRLPAHTS